MALNTLETDRRERLAWLGRLRWWAMAGSIIGMVVARGLGWDFFHQDAIAAGVGMGLALNGFLVYRVRHAGDLGQNELFIHATIDLFLLTWFLSWSGGIKNPLTVFFSFHVVLGALLNGRRGTIVAAAASLSGLGALWLLEFFGILPTEPLSQVPDLLWFFTLALLLGGLSYFALVLAYRLREQRNAALVMQKRQLNMEHLATLGRAMQGVAHELNTPLMTMQTLAKDLHVALAEQKFPETVRLDVEESIDLIIDETKRCRGLTQGLLATAREEGAFKGKGANVLDLTRRAFQLVGHSAEKSDIGLAPDLEKFTTIVDGDRVLQIMMNLIQNALLATESQNGERLRIWARNENRDLLIGVQDLGGGLPDDVKKHLFEPFVTTRREEGGTGLGLYMSATLARELGGELILGDREDGLAGTLALLRLPQEEQRDRQKS